MPRKTSKISYTDFINDAKFCDPKSYTALKRFTPIQIYSLYRNFKSSIFDIRFFSKFFNQAVEAIIINAVDKNDLQSLRCHDEESELNNEQPPLILSHVSNSFFT